MKSIILTTLLIFGLLTVHGQSDSLRVYTGKYKFNAGSPINEISVIIENGTLMITSVMGGSELRKESGDVFVIVAYSGTATFRRNADNQVVGILIEVQDIKMEGSRSE